VQVNHGMIVGIITRIVLNNLDLYIQKKKLSASGSVSFTLLWHTRDQSGSYGNTYSSSSGTGCNCL
jgi:hypothetical protein